MLNRRRLTPEALIGAFLISLVLLPYIGVFGSIGEQHNSDFLSYILNERVLSLIQSSLILSAIVAIISSCIGVIVVSCIVLSRSDSLSKLLLISSGIMFCISPVVILSAWQPLIPEIPPLWKVVIILSFSYFPISAFILWRALHNLDIPGLEFGRLCANPKKIIRFIVSPQLKTPLLISSLIIFLFGFTQSEVPSLLGYPVYAEEFLARIILEDTLGPAVILAFPMLMVTLLIMPFLIWHGRKLIIQSWKIGGTKILKKLFHTQQTIKITALIILLTIFSPMVFLFLHSGFDNFISSTWTTILSSLKLALLSTLLTTFLAYLIAEGITACNSFYRIIFTGIFLIQILLPGSLFGIGMVNLSQLAFMNWLKTGDLLLILTHALRVLPLLVLLMLSLRWHNSIDKIQELELIGIGWLRRQIYIRLPEAKPNILIAAALGFILALSELSTTILVVAPGTETIILRLYNLMHYGDWKSVSALALVQALMVTTILASTYLLGMYSNDKD